MFRAHLADISRGDSVSNESRGRANGHGEPEERTEVTRRCHAGNEQSFRRCLKARVEQREAILHIDMPQNIDAALERLLYDPQTSGGLLIALPPPAAEAMVARLHADDLSGAVVGRVEAGEGVLVVQ